MNATNGHAAAAGIAVAQAGAAPHAALADATPLTQDARIVDFDEAAGPSVVTETVADPANPILPGHYPGFPIFPGVCLIECAHRSVLAAARRIAESVALREVASTRFLNPVFPGDVVTTRATVKPSQDTWDVTAQLSVGERKSATVRLKYGLGASTAALVPQEAATEPVSVPKGLEPLDTAVITRHLPHRHPMLLVDRVTSVVPGQRLTALKAVTASEPWFRPPAANLVTAGFLPSVLLVESWCQAAGLLATWESPNPDVRGGEVMLFGSLSGVRLLAPVPVGSLVRHRVRLVRAADGVFVFDGVADIDGAPVLEVGQVLVAMRPASALREARNDASRNGADPR